MTIRLNFLSTIETNLIAVRLLALLTLCLAAGCVSRTDSPLDFRTDKIPEVDNVELCYLSTDLALDGGSIFQSYAAPDGGIYKLWFMPLGKGAKKVRIFWITPNGTSYAVGASGNATIIEEFLAKMRSKYRANLDVRGDIEHALLVVTGLQAPALWNFSSLRSED